MTSHPLVRRLLPVVESGASVLTLTLDLAGSEGLPPRTRVFLRNTVLKTLESPEAPPSERAVRRRIARRIRNEAEDLAAPAANGLFLAAGPGLWEWTALRTPLANFFHLDRIPYLAPLLEAESRAPRTYAVHLDPRQARIDEIHLGETATLARLAAPAATRDDAEHLAGRRSADHGIGRAGAGPGRAAAERDRHRRRLDEATHGLLRETAGVLGAFHLAAPAEWVFFVGNREHFPALRELLPGTLRDRALYGGPRIRNETETCGRLTGTVGRMAGQRMEREIAEFRDRHAHDCRTALGPQDVLEHLSTGNADRVFLNAYDPVPGGLCTTCGSHLAAPLETCPYCRASLQAASLTQEVVAFSLTHPPLPLTFVPPPADWLRPLGGMAALLTARGVRRRIVAVGG